MSLVSFTPIQDGVTGVNAAATNTPLSTIYNDYNGNITDANIASNAAIAFSKISGGSATALTAWSSWTPTWTNLTTGNGTLNYAKYTQIGKEVRFRLKFTLGSTTAVGTSITVSLPVNLNADYTSPDAQLITVTYYDLSATTPYVGGASTNSSSTLLLRVLHTDGARGNLEVLSGSDPFTFATGDIIYLNGSYEGV